MFSAILKEGDIVPGNSHFDTTKGHIEFRKATAIDCTIDEAFDTSIIHPFKGNIDLKKLETVFKKYPKEKIPFVILTITCNSAGGQPVSVKNTKEVSTLCKKYGIPLYFDAARFSENAYFIKKREVGFENKTIKEIVKEVFSYGDGMTMSAKKDGLVNMGGFIALNNEDVFKKATVFNIMFEGFITYGGMNGRDMGALAVGLDESTEFNYLESRIEQVISNILENSISFSPEKSTLRINIESKNNYAKIIITDEGPGFNESNIGKVFERFYSNRPKEMFGLHSGLGLNIVKNIVESHKGHIKAYNLNQEGRRGAVVEIDLPIAD